MRRLLTIFLLLFAAAAVQSDVIVATESGSQRVVCAVLTSDDGMPIDAIDVPLFAVTTTSSLPDQMCGGEGGALKGRQSIQDNLDIFRYFQHRNPTLSPAQNVRVDEIPIMGRRAADRYVYAMRKIII